jgi:hypothetical protein
LIRAARIIAGTLLTCTAVFAFAAPAQATAYRYWSYWNWTGTTWSYSNTGPSAQVHSGAVIGWRFAIQADSSHALAPRTGGGYPDVCGSNKGSAGVVIDYGTQQDAPSGEHPPSSAVQRTCVDDSSSENGYHATQDAAPIRTNDSGLVCGIDGYPAHECGATVSSPKPKASTAPPHHTAAPEPPDAQQRAQAKAGGALPSTGEAAGATATPHASAATAARASPGTAASASADVLPVTTTAPVALTKNGGGTSVGLIVGAVLVVGLGGLAVWRFRRSPR